MNTKLGFKWSKAKSTVDQQSTKAQKQEEEDEDDADDVANGRTHVPIRRNSRFYRSMRRKTGRERATSRERAVSRERVSEDAQSNAVPVKRADDTSSSRMSGPPSSLRPPPPMRHSLSPRLPRATSPFQPGAVLQSNGESGRHSETPSIVTELKEVLQGKSVSPHHRQQRPMSSGRPRSHNSDMESLSDNLESCSIQGHDSRLEEQANHGQATEDVNDLDPISVRLLNNGEASKGPAVYPNIRIIGNVGILYQEYRDTSKQREIEQRRRCDALAMGTAVPGGGGGGMPSIPVMQLQLRNSTHGSINLWQNLEPVRQSGVLANMSPREVTLQEAMFELVTSEASYYKSMELLESHFLRNPILVNTLNQSEMHFIFSNIEDVMKASERFLIDLENRVEKSVKILDVCDLVDYHAKKHFHVFVTYVSNQNYQEQAYRRILQENSAFRDVMTSLENQPRCRGLSFTSFLILPFQRITRLKLLVQNILKKAEEGSDIEASAVQAHQELEKIVKKCNEGVRKMSRTEELISIEKTLEFKSKSVPVISHSRWLLKRGELQQISGPKSTRTLRSRKLFQPLYLFLFNDLLLVTKKSSSGEKFQVLDSCTKALLRTEEQEDQGQTLAKAFLLRLIENQDGRDITYMLKASSDMEKRRWINALTPNPRTRFLTSNSNQPDSPQVQCILSYMAQEHDELSVEMADIINVLEKTEDGWMLGERLHDSEMGWFPSRVVEEIQNQELRAQNLRECQRIQQAQGNGARTVGTKGRRLRSSHQ
ncbi:ephexin-1 isoform X2 [Amia ocellicauda]|uniref:ephexin-1 isoform X2 n=1 Tax=Amia ocellicauda TaxID=2972642 RepID=UPI003463FA33